MEGNQHLLLKYIVGYQKSEAVFSKTDKYIIYKGRKSLKKTTWGCNLCVQWRDVTSIWEIIRVLKESDPLEVAEQALAQEIDD